ncbi:MAG: DUF1737 domain-containing protein [Isosphaeraceae bacterium]
MVYEVIEKKSLADLQESVNRRIVEGYRPIGGISVVQSQASGDWWFYQAVIREGKPQPIRFDDVA